MWKKTPKEERTIVFNTRTAEKSDARESSQVVIPKKESNDERIRRIMEQTSYVVKVY